MKSFFLICLLFNLKSFCQKRIAVDALTGDTSYYVKNIFMYGKKGVLREGEPNLTFTVLKNKSSFVMSFNGNYNGHIITTLRKNDSVSFKFLSGAIFSTPYLESKITDYRIDGHTTSFQQMLLLDTDLIDSLCKEPIVFVRFRTVDKNFDYIIPEQNQSLLSQNLTLFREGDN